MFGAVYREYLIICKFYKSNSHMTRLFGGDTTILSNGEEELTESKFQ